MPAFVHMLTLLIHKAQYKLSELRYASLLSSLVWKTVKPLHSSKAADVILLRGAGAQLMSGLGVSDLRPFVPLRPRCYRSCSMPLMLLV